VVATPARPMMVEKTELVIGDGNWEKVKNYAVSNKEIGSATIIKNLEKKYKLSTEVKTELKSLVK
jgi:hypothetical protein